MAELVLQNVYKSYEGNPFAVKDISLEVRHKEFVVLVGPSGCGKSTLLRMIAGLEQPTQGEIYIDGECVNALEPKERDIAMVFQSYALYPHMSVYDNIAFPLKMRKIPKQEIQKRVIETAETLEITHLLKRKPKELSGGQQQRVAIGRAIIRRPKILLMDEPLSNLDVTLRQQMRSEFMQLRQKIDTTFIYVTHDQLEAMTLGDRIIVLNQGEIQQVDRPLSLYHNPINQFVAGFIGTPRMNFATVQLTDNGLEIFGKKITFSEQQKQLFAQKQISLGEYTLSIRPEHLRFEEKEESPMIEGEIEMVEVLGNVFQVHLNFHGEKWIALQQVQNASNYTVEDFVVGKVMPVYFDVGCIHWFDKASGQSITK